MLSWFKSKRKLTLVEAKDISRVVDEKTKRIEELQARISQLSRENTKLRAMLGHWDRWFAEAPLSITDLETTERKYHGSTLEN
jgi:hypothetical protein